jgi:hypothetical protein
MACSRLRRRGIGKLLPCGTRERAARYVIKWLTLDRDNIAVLAVEDTSKNILATWKFDAETGNYTVTVGELVSVYKLLLLAHADICLLIKGDAASADLGRAGPGRGCF